MRFLNLLKDRQQFQTPKCCQPLRIVMLVPAKSIHKVKLVHRVLELFQIKQSKQQNSNSHALIIQEKDQKNQDFQKQFNKSTHFAIYLMKYEKLTNQILSKLFLHIVQNQFILRDSHQLAMIGKITFDRHTHLVSSSSTFEQLKKIVARVFENAPKNFQIVFIKQKDDIHFVVQNDHDLNVFYQLQSENDEIFSLIIIPLMIEKKEVEDEEEDEFYLLDENETKPMNIKENHPSTNAESRNLQNKSDLINKLIELQVNQKMKHIQGQFQMRIQSMFAQYDILSRTNMKTEIQKAVLQNLSKNQNKSFAIPSIFDPSISIVNCPFGYSSCQKLEGYKIAIKQEQNEEVSDEQEQVINSIRNLVSAKNVEEPLEINLLSQYDEKYVYINCKICYRSLVNKDFYQCKMCPKAYYCHTCQKAQINCHELEHTDYQTVLHGKTKVKAYKKSNVLLSQDVSPPKITKHINKYMTQEERILYFADELHNIFSNFSRISILKFVRKNSFLDLQELAEKLNKGGKSKLKAMLHRCM